MKILENSGQAIDFFMPMAKVPTATHQEKKVHIVKGKPVFYEPAELKVARSKMMGSLSKHVPGQKFAGPLRLVVKWCFPITGKHSDGEWKHTKPDNGNLNKLLEDCMEDLGFFKNDAQIASSITEKFWAKIPGIYIRLEEL